VNYRSRPFILLAIVAALVGVYALWWFAQLRAFKADVAALGQGKPAFAVTAKTLDYGGFPYRMELTATDVTLKRARADYSLAVTAPKMVLIRQPWDRNFILGSLTQPKVRLSANLKPEFAPVTATADGAQMSLRVSEKGVRRLSVTFEKYQGTLPWSSKKLTAGHLEFHGREFVAHDTLPKWLPENPTPPAIFEIYLSGENVMLERGPFKLAARAEVTADPKYPHGYDRLADWARAGGTLELRALSLERGTISDTVTRGTVSLDPTNRVIGGLTVDTGCGSWLYQTLDQPEPAGLPKCGNILRHNTIQIGAQGVTVARDK
jgi:hypothetical protein